MDIFIYINIFRKLTEEVLGEGERERDGVHDFCSTTPLLR